MAQKITFHDCSKNLNVCKTFEQYGLKIDVSTYNTHTTMECALDVGSSSVSGRDSVVYAFSVKFGAKHFRNLQHIQFVHISQLIPIFFLKKHGQTCCNIFREVLIHMI